jgi:hypothetical protein
MNPLDELLSATGRVDDITPAGLRHGRAALDSAIGDTRNVQSSASQAEPFRRPRRPHRKRMPWLVAACTAAVAAVVAGTTVTMLSNHSGGTQAGGEKPASVTSGNSTGGTDVTAAVLLRAAGKAAGAQKGGWPNAAYWHVVSVYVRSGKTYHRDIWISHYGNGVLRDDGVSSGPMDLGQASFEGLSWAQLYALPTDPAQLQSVLQSKFTNGFPKGSPSPGAVSQSAELYTVVGDLLRESPASPALREALYEVAANIPGVEVKGHYTDALGRTGIAVERGGEILVVDPSNGQLLADIEGDPSAPESCTPSTSPTKGASACFSGGVGYTYVNQGPATSAP